MAAISDLGAILAPLSTALGGVFKGQLENELNMPRVQEAAARVAERQFSPLFDLEKYRQNKEVEAQKLEQQSAFNQARIADMDDRREIARQNAETQRFNADTQRRTSDTNANTSRSTMLWNESRARDMQRKLEEAARINGLRDQLRDIPVNMENAPRIASILMQMDPDSMKTSIGKMLQPAGAPKTAKTEQELYSQLLATPREQWSPAHAGFMQRYEAAKTAERDNKLSLGKYHNMRTQYLGNRLDPSKMAELRKIDKSTITPMDKQRIITSTESIAQREVPVLLRDMFGITSAEKLSPDITRRQVAYDWLKTEAYNRIMDSRGMPELKRKQNPMPSELKPTAGSTFGNWLSNLWAGERAANSAVVPSDPAGVDDDEPEEE